jgi:hypothetical protein
VRALLALAVAGLLSAVPGGSTPAGPGDAAASPASAKKAQWKRCGRAARRHVKRRRAVRGRCARLTPRRARAGRDRLADLLAPTPTAPGTPPSGTEDPAPGPITLSSVGVTTGSPTEFALTLSRPSVPAGAVRFAVRNAGEDPHNLQVRRDLTSLTLVSFPTLDPGATDRETTQLTAGRYVLWCSLEGHEAMGMHTTLEVG